MTTNPLDPRNIPDMSLDSPSEMPAPTVRLDSSSAYQAKPKTESITPSLPAAAPTDSAEAPTDWQEGDRVLAPWEPTFLYPGTIREILKDEARGDQALISFDDGGEGWVFLYSLCPRKFEEGQQVHVRRVGAPHYFPAQIEDVDSFRVRVRFDGGGREWVNVSQVRIPCIANGPAAVSTQLASWQSPTDGTAPGTGVPYWVIWAGLMLVLGILRIGCRAMQN
jgi:hypothetical protein